MHPGTPAGTSRFSWTDENEAGANDEETEALIEPTDSTVTNGQVPSSASGFSGQSVRWSLAWLAASAAIVASSLLLLVNV